MAKSAVKPPLRSHGYAIDRAAGGDVDAADRIETDLLRIQANILRDRGLGRFPERLSNAPPPILGIPACNTRDREEANDSSAPQADGSHCSHAPRQRAQPVSSAL